MSAPVRWSWLVTVPSKGPTRLPRSVNASHWSRHCFNHTCRASLIRSPQLEPVSLRCSLMCYPHLGIHTLVCTTYQPRGSEEIFRIILKSPTRRVNIMLD